MQVSDYHEHFASLYDTMYSDRDFVADAQYASALLELNEHHDHVLDFGCGAGSHVLAFGKIGIKATGVDISSAMISQAHAKRVSPDSAPVEFYAGSFKHLCDQLNGHRFDGAVSIFQVFNCMQNGEEMLANLKLLRGKLRNGRRFLIDLWNGAAVFVDDPHPEIREYTSPTTNHEVIRITIPTVDRINQRCTLRYKFIEHGRNDTPQAFESLHELIFLTPVQYRQLFREAGFEILDEFRRGHPGTPITTDDWYISYLVCAGE